MSEKKHLLGNSPINTYDEDLFNFKHYAEKVKRIIQLNSSNTDPLTIGIYGKWGEGKTSFLNLLKYKIDHFNKEKNDKEYLIYDFNPWRYSTEEEMLYDFFDGISKIFYIKKENSEQQVGKWISKYSKYLKAIKISATVGIPKILNSKIEFNADKIFEALGEDLSGEEISLDFFKDKVNEAINNTNFKVVIFVDDLDRLDKNEIYTILKLIKLNASFDNFIFITSLDSEYVAKAIKDRYGDNDEDGKFFLEKIINIPIHLPKIEEEDLQYFFETKFNQIIKYLEPKDFKKKQDELKEVIEAFTASRFNSPREIIRVLNGFFIGAFGFEDEVNLKDLFWIEWIKVKNEKLYSEIKNYKFFGSKSLYYLQSPIIDFNDGDIDLEIDAHTIVTKESINGTRKLLFKNYPSYIEVISLLFPDFKINEIEYEIFNQNLNINSIYHFNKYFSFHTERKVKNTTILNIKKFVNEKDEKFLMIEFSDLVKNLSSNTFYTIDGLIKFYKYPNSDIESRNFFYDFIIKNLYLVPDFEENMLGVDSKTRIIELIAALLNADTIDNEAIALKIAANLDVRELCHFTRKFNVEKTKFKDKLENLISDKANYYFSRDIPLVLENSVTNKMIMQLWKQYDLKSFEKHIVETIVDIEIIKKLIRQFPPFWNNSDYGSLDKTGYDYLSKLIDVNFIYDKIEEFTPYIINKVKSHNYVFLQKDTATENDNLEEFIYWYLKENWNTSK